MRNLIVRTLVGIVFVWVLLECTASQNVWYYILWGVVGILSLWEFFTLLLNHSLKSKALWAVGGTLYIAASIALIFELAPHWPLVIMMLTMVWGNDVGAFLVGISIGKHKMAPKISPKKSWEGFFGGVASTIGIAVGWYYLNPSIGNINGVLEGITLGKWCIVGLIVSLGAVLGDLLESYFKRRIGVKDSGKMLPGHGGMLDRFDATLLATILFYISITLFDLI
ncbi:MAG: CDP-archaeol synthase [Rikenellaceae bacterium]